MNTGTGAAEMVAMAEHHTRKQFEGRCPADPVAEQALGRAVAPSRPLSSRAIESGGESPGIHTVEGSALLPTTSFRSATADPSACPPALEQAQLGRDDHRKMRGNGRRSR